MLWTKIERASESSLCRKKFQRSFPDDGILKIYVFAHLQSIITIFYPHISIRKHQPSQVRPFFLADPVGIAQVLAILLFRLFSVGVIRNFETEFIA